MTFTDARRGTHEVFELAMNDAKPEAQQETENGPCQWAAVDILSDQLVRYSRELVGDIEHELRIRMQANSQVLYVGIDRSQIMSSYILICSN